MIRCNRCQYQDAPDNQEGYSRENFVTFDEIYTIFYKVVELCFVRNIMRHVDNRPGNVLELRSFKNMFEVINEIFCKLMIFSSNLFLDSLNYACQETSHFTKIFTTIPT